MRLRYNPASPYVRKVMVTALETGLDGRIEPIMTMPWDTATDLPADNPIGKIPVLITDGGESLYDSTVICEYLDSLHDGAKLFPPTGGERWAALKLMALADGALDAGILRLIQLRRPPEDRSAWWIERQTTVVGRCLDVLAGSVDEFGRGLTIGHVTAGCLLGWLDFRFAEEDWRPGRDALAAWYAGFAERPSMRGTTPAEPPTA